MLLGLLFKPDTCIQNILKRVFPHDLFECESIGTGFKALFFGQLYPVFIYIVHTAGQPSFFVGGKDKIFPDLQSGILARPFDVKVDINITETVFFIVPQHQEYSVQGSSVLYSKFKRRPETTFPGMLGNGHCFFIKINGSATVQQARNKDGNDRPGEKLFQIWNFHKSSKGLKSLIV